MVLTKEDVLKKLPELEPYYRSVGEYINKGNSVIVDPNGEIMAGPLDAKEGGYFLLKLIYICYVLQNGTLMSQVIMPVLMHLN